MEYLFFLFILSMPRFKCKQKLKNRYIDKRFWLRGVQSDERDARRMAMYVRNMSENVVYNHLILMEGA